MKRPELILFNGSDGPRYIAKVKYPNHQHFELDYLISDGEGQYWWCYGMGKDNTWVLKNVRIALSEERDVVVSGEFLTRDSVQPFTDLGNLYKANIKFVEARNCSTTAVDEYGLNWLDFAGMMCAGLVVFGGLAFVVGMMIATLVRALI